MRKSVASKGFHIPIRPMDIFKLLNRLHKLAPKGQWDALEEHYYEKAVKLAGQKTADLIRNVDVTSYSQTIETALRKTVEEALEENAAAILYEYDLDNEWTGQICWCSEYFPEDKAESDDWAAGAIGNELPPFPELARYYDEDFSGSKSTSGTNAYLIARTTAMFGRCVDKLPPLDMAVCIAFHDQDPLTRIREGRERVDPKAEAARQALAAATPENPRGFGIIKFYVSNKAGIGQPGLLCQVVEVSSPDQVRESVTDAQGMCMFAGLSHSDDHLLVVFRDSAAVFETKIPRGPGLNYVPPVVVPD